MTEGIKEEKKEVWTVLDNSNIAESYPGITLPLTYSFVKDAYAGVFRGIVGQNIKNLKTLKLFDETFNSMIYSYNGRVYYRLNNWYALLTLIPFSKKIIPIWQDMLGISNKKYSFNSNAVFKFTRLQKLGFYCNAFFNSFNIPKKMDNLNSDFDDIQNYFKTSYNDKLENNSLIEIYYQLEKNVLDKWYITLSNDLYAFIWTGLLKRKLIKKHRPDGEIAEYISGLGGLESIKPLKALLVIAEKYGMDDDLLGRKEVSDYIEIYGDRSVCELKLEVMTFRENPQALVEKIREYASDKKKLGSIIANLERAETKEKSNGYILKRAKLGIRNREISRLNRSRVYGMVRRLFLNMGENLARESFIDKAEDVFYLTKEELFSGDYSDFKEKISYRKREYEKYATLPAYSRLIFRGANPNEWGEPLIDDKDIDSDGAVSLYGTGTSSGRVTGKAVVLTDPNQNADVKDKIIITKTTDPGWVFLLARAKGIVAEKGSLLSHTAIVSRELNIPAVVGVKNATEIIKTGDTITIDGAEGIVEFV